MSSVAQERMEILFQLADRRIDEGEKELADRYVELARRIGMKHNVSIPSELRKSYCHSCKAYLKPCYNCTVRIDSKAGTVNYKCEECGEVNRYGFQDS